MSIGKVISMWSGGKMAAELVPFSTCKCAKLKKKKKQNPTHRHQPLCTSVLDQCYLSSSFVTIIRDWRLSYLFSQVFPICMGGKRLICFLMMWRNGGGEWPMPSAIPGWLHGDDPQQGSTTSLSHKTKYKQAVCHPLSVRSCMTSGTMVYKIWAKRRMIDKVLSNSSYQKPEMHDKGEMVEGCHVRHKALQRSLSDYLGWLCVFFFSLFDPNTHLMFCEVPMNERHGGWQPSMKVLQENLAVYF